MQTSNETKYSRKISKRVPSCHVVENAIQQGTPDICLPTQLGWLWVELKVLRANSIFVKKTQWAAMTAEMKLTPDLRRKVWIADEYGFSTHNIDIILGWPTRPTAKGLFVAVEQRFPIGLSELLDQFGVYTKDKK